jgi:hypothetical protein
MRGTATNSKRLIIRVHAWMHVTLANLGGLETLTARVLLTALTPTVCAKLRTAWSVRGEFYDLYMCTVLESEKPVSRRSTLLRVLLCRAEPGSFA